MNSPTSFANGELRVTADRTLRLSIFEPEGSSGEVATIVFIPGFKGFKDWGGWPWFCSLISKAGYRVVSMNPTMCGVGPALQEFDEPEKFARQTLSHDLEDLDALFHSEWIPSANPLVLLGHSRGGIVAALGGARVQSGPGADKLVDLRGVITLGTPHDLMRLSQEELDLWKETGYREIVNARTGEVLKQELSVLEDYIANTEKYDPVRALASCGIPFLGIHGTADPAVGTESLDHLFAACSHPLSRRELIEGAGHTFGMAHPHQGGHEDAETAIALMTAWLGEVIQR